MKQNDINNNNNNHNNNNNFILRNCSLEKLNLLQQDYLLGLK